MSLANGCSTASLGDYVTIETIADAMGAVAPVRSHLTLEIPFPASGLPSWSDGKREADVSASSSRALSPPSVLPLVNTHGTFLGFHAPTPSRHEARNPLVNVLILDMPNCRTQPVWWNDDSVGLASHSQPLVSDECGARTSKRLHAGDSRSAACRCGPAHSRNCAETSSSPVRDSRACTGACAVDTTQAARDRTAQPRPPAATRRASRRLRRGHDDGAVHRDALRDCQVHVARACAHPCCVGH